jgi:hypothetical protein
MKKNDKNTVNMNVVLGKNDEVISVEISDRVEKDLEQISNAGGTPNLFPNVNLEDPDIFGIQQAVKESLDVVKEIDIKEIELEEKKRQQSGGSHLKFERGDRGLRIEPNRGWSSQVSKSHDSEVTSNLQDIKSARFLQDTYALFARAVRKGSFRLNDRITDIIKDTGISAGKRPRQSRIKSFSQSILLASRTDLRRNAPTWTDDRGRVNKVKANEVFEQFYRLLDLQGVLWATDKMGNKTYIKRVIGELLPTIQNKNQFRGDVLEKGFFKLNAENESNRVFLASYLMGRFSQNQDITIEGNPLKPDRGFLIEQAKYTQTDKTNPSKASEQLEQALNRLQELNIIGEWNVEVDSSHKIPTDNKAKIYIYPPENIQKALIAKVKPTNKTPKVSTPEYLKRLRAMRKSQTLTELTTWLECSPDAIEKLLSQEIKPNKEQLEKLTFE